MHYTPLQSLFEHSFYAVSDLVFLTLNIYAASIVRRGKWRVHLGWIAPFVLQGVLTLIYRGILSLHYFLDVHLSASAYAFGINSLYAANVAGIMGNVILCRTLKKMVNSTDGDAGQCLIASRPEAEEDVWPPPPQGRF